MSMDSAMDSLSTTSEHSVASSTEANINIKSSLSPAINNNNNSSNASSNHTSSHNHHNNRSPTPVSPPIIGRHHQSSPLASGGPHMMPMPHPLSPPQVSTPNSIAAMGPRMAQSLPHLPPHGLGLLNSLQMMHHANPLELMAAAHHHGPPRSYNSPPPISTSDPTANECKLVDYRGQKVAAFIIAGDTMLCLPQAFELFLKHLVGGLHTVYTKLKRLDIVPLVCNVEQVRILRGLGAIQPGVNRCKLLSCKDFDILYRDCTTARCLSVKPPERPGRPPKRGPVGLSLPASHLSHHPQLKKHRLDNGDYPYENGHLNDMSRLEKSPLLANGYNPPPHLNHMQFMQMNHHPGAMMSPGLPPHGMTRPDGTMMKGQPGMPGMDAIARSGIWENCRAAYEDIVKHLERLREERGDERSHSIDPKPRDLSSQNGSSNGHSPVLNLSKSGGLDQGSTGDQSDRSEGHSPPPSIRDEEENISDDNVSDVDEREEKEEDLSETERDMSIQQQPTSAPNSDSHQQAINYSSLAATAAAVAASGAKSSVPGPDQQNLSSTETLLRNIQSLLTVAADNARQQERQISYEKAELKMDVLRERECKDSMERQFSDERKLRVLYQKRFKKERKVRVRLQQQLETELKRRSQIEDALKASGAPAEALRIISESQSSDRRNDQRPASADRRTESPYTQSSNRERDRDRDTASVPTSQASQQSNQQTQPTADGKPWNYPGLDLMATGAFWQNYSESLAQEIELERKARQQTNDRDVKSPLQDRPNYYKNSVLFSSAT
ncbi:dachshund homolog 2 isoform X2 [Bradysia coprophila]|uniref:dachshund homolog 2 isoform X2 n=1 Tax=Bradysia coprophila TaxID=38358 RepID=UPI00187DC2EA|nr:dachshund homolog 2 isoform X2 [Bradysia coprophila]